MIFLDTLPEWQRYLALGIAMCVLICASAVILGRAGRSPYWALFAVVPVPWMFAMLVWILAFCRWPNASPKR